MRLRSSFLTSPSFARMRSRRLLRCTRNLPRSDLPQMKTKPRKRKVSGLPSPAFARLSAAWRPNSIRRVLSGCSESANSSNRTRSVGVPYNDDIALGLSPSPAVGPEVEHVVHVDVGEQGRNYRTLSRPHLTDRDDPLFQDTRLQPFADQADDALIADAVLHEADQPIFADRIERSIHRLPIATMSQIR